MTEYQVKFTLCGREVSRAIQAASALEAISTLRKMYFGHSLEVKTLYPTHFLY